MVLNKGLKRKSNVTLVTLAYIFPLEQKSQLTMSNSGFIEFNKKDITIVIQEETANNATKTELEEGLAGVVRSINGNVPDVNGDVEIQAGITLKVWSE